MTEELKMCIDECRESMQKSIGHLESELAKIRAGRANPKMLDGIMVDYYGNQSPINQVANIKTLDARTLIVQPWEKTMLEGIEHAIQAANIGINPQNDGESIILAIPTLTEERRKDLVKQTRHEAEQAKIGLRAARKSAIDMIKMLKDEGLSEDMQKKGEDEIQKVIEEFGKKVDNHIEVKEAEIMKV